VTLLHPIFGEFIDDCKHQPTDRDNTLVLELSTAMSAFYTGEDGRARRIREIFANYGIHLVRTRIERTGYETDSDPPTVASSSNLSLPNLLYFACRLDDAAL
jgi:hypothetical protein